MPRGIGGRVYTVAAGSALGANDAAKNKAPDRRGLREAEASPYMRAIMASPKAEQDSSLAPSMRRAKS